MEGTPNFVTVISLLLQLFYDGRLGLINYFERKGNLQHPIGLGLAPFTLPSSNTLLPMKLPERSEGCQTLTSLKYFPIIFLALVCVCVCKCVWGERVCVNVCGEREREGVCVCVQGGVWTI